MTAISNYIKSAIQEFNNITWPTRKQAVRISVIVFVFMVVSSIVLGAVDQLLSTGYKLLLNL